MCSQDHKAFIIPQCFFDQNSRPETLSAENLEPTTIVGKRVLHAVENALEAFKGKDGLKYTVIFTTSTDEMQSPCDGIDIIQELSALFAELKGFEFQSFLGGKTIQEALLAVKKLTDELNISDITFLVPETQISLCQRIGPLVYNEKAYSLNFLAVDIEVKKEDRCSDEEISNSITLVLSNLPSSDGLPIATLQSLLIPEDVFYHGYTTRAGGVSTFPTMKSLNMCFSPKKKDTRAFVEENRRRLAKHAGFEHRNFQMPNAVHSIEVWVIGDKKPDVFDAMVTDKPGITLGAPGADCQTMLFCDPQQKVVAAAHSGWKGTVDRIQQNVVRVMKERFGCNPKDILVSIGPSIGQCCYNVNKERAQQFIDSVAPSTVIWRDGVPFLDLWHTSVLLLQQVGIKRQNIDDGARFSNAELNGKEKVPRVKRK